uniref:A-kinase anchor protein 7-like phosphoesterase domain-containing protein n=1 Tax=Lotharella oceanica TaxID=641309 RepID=A0A7S2X9G6_9EUKA|eukprot:CAMPEP_0170172472 /NCGR_PEP_ID=MMETSP0040_2-20121228/5697_1 /TAXON_ID=641309 /ORGANISM="Lotharella oceanica, Strain CCMP622" /LENGTH=381 /DNA_ID=CAMNT_0010413131 /DNA_START=69 /DNA_END=1214 /DNA_ORIENTATION=-
MKNNMYISSTDVRLQMAKMAQGQREQKIERRKNACVYQQQSVSYQSSNCKSASSIQIQTRKRWDIDEAELARINHQLSQATLDDSNHEDGLEEGFVGGVPGGDAVEYAVDTGECESRSESLAKTRSRKRANVRANYFVCVRIDEREVVEKVRDFQFKLEAQRPELKNTFIDPASLHVTVCVFAIDGPHEMKKIRLALSTASKQLTQSLHAQPLQLAIDGVGSFGNRVLFGKVQHGQLYLEALRKSVVAAAKSLGCMDSIVDPDKPLSAHVTVAKMSRGQNVTKGFDLSLLETLVRDAFGFQTCKELLLCPVGSSKPGEFYTVEMKSRIVSEDNEHIQVPGQAMSKKELQSVLDGAIRQNNSQRKRPERPRRRLFAARSHNV